MSRECKILCVSLPIGNLHKESYTLDDRETQEEDSPTIGIILCTEKDENIVRYSVLEGSEQLFASKYKAQLPTIEELEAELQRERRLLEGE